MPPRDVLKAFQNFMLKRAKEGPYREVQRKAARRALSSLRRRHEAEYQEVLTLELEKCRREFQKGESKHQTTGTQEEV